MVLLQYMTSSSSLGEAFSFDTPEAVLRVLASIRASDATADQKNELRDLVLSYTNGGKDPSVQIQISQRLQSLGVALAAAPAPATPPVAPVVHDFGSARNVPTFTPSKASQASSAPTPKPDPQPSAAPVEPPAPAAPAPTPAAAEPVAKAPEPVVAPAAPEQPAPQPPEAEPEAPATMPEVPAAPTPPAKVEANPTPAASQSVNPESDEALIRIREIKSLVNQKVGNPVNLVDIDNVVGREYMSALLDAMKQLNSGNSTLPAMKRLESAYVAVEEVLKTKGTQPAQPPVAAAPAPPAPPVQPVAAPAPVEPTPQPATPITPVQPVTPPSPEPTPAPVAPTPAPTPKPVEQSQPKINATANDRWGAAAPQPPATPSPAETVPVKPAGEPAAATVPARAPVIKSLNDSATPLKTIDDVPTAASINSSESGDPLYTKEVSNGLNQLLSDWSLFKKSGLFGTGPKGIDHPLYAKVKDLQIPLLLAGRFEGATQEIKQSVTDYMNGWRYEQGIIYEQGEIFDHYLRRVIRHILDLQK